MPRLSEFGTVAFSRRQELEVGRRPLSKFQRVSCNDTDSSENPYKPYTRNRYKRNVAKHISNLSFE